MKTSSAISFKAQKYVTLQEGGVGGEKKKSVIFLGHFENTPFNVFTLNFRLLNEAF